MAKTKIDKDVEIIVANNVNGGFFYQSPNGSLIIDLDEKGAEEYVTFSELKSIMSRKRAILEDLTLLIVDVDSDDVTVDDVVDALRLKDVYAELQSIADEEMIDTNTIYSFVTSGDVERIEKITSSPKSKIRNRIYETAVEAYRNRDLTDLNILNAISKNIGTFDTHNYWRDSDITQ